MDSRAVFTPADAGQEDLSPALMAALSLDDSGAAVRRLPTQRLGMACCTPENCSMLIHISRSGPPDWLGI